MLDDPTVTIARDAKDLSERAAERFVQAAGEAIRRAGPPAGSGDCTPGRGRVVASIVQPVNTTVKAI